MKQIGWSLIWTFNDMPEKGEYVLISNGPFQDWPQTEGRLKNKRKLIKLGKEKKSRMYSSLRIYNDKKQIVWDAFLPTTMEKKEEDYDPEYFRKVVSKK